jgi:hypothetical protein
MHRSGGGRSAVTDAVGTLAESGVYTASSFGVGPSRTRTDSTKPVREPQGDLMSCRRLSLFAISTVIAPTMLLVGGCVTAPYNHQSECPNNAFTVTGFAQNPGATVQVQAFNDDTSAWEVVATTTASGSGLTFGGNTAYSWSSSVTLADRHFTPFTPDAFASLRVREVNGSLSYLVTFESDGISCVVDKVFNQNESWFAAGWECRSPASPVVSLVCIG